MSLPHPPKNSPDYLQVVVLNKEPLFYCTRDGPYYPTLRLLHQCAQWAFVVAMIRDVVWFG